MRVRAMPGHYQSQGLKYRNHWPIRSLPPLPAVIRTSVSSPTSGPASLNLRAIFNSGFSSSTCTPAIRSLFGTCNTFPDCVSFSPPVMLTALTSHPSRLDRSISTTGSPTPVESTATALPAQVLVAHHVPDAFHNLRMRGPERHSLRIPQHQPASSPDRVPDRASENQGLLVRSRDSSGVRATTTRWPPI